MDVDIDDFDDFSHFKQKLKSAKLTAPLNTDTEFNFEVIKSNQA